VLMGNERKSGTVYSPVQLQALERMTTVYRVVLLAEHEVTSDMVAAHLKNFYPHMLFYSSQTWALPAISEILARCQVCLAWRVVGEKASTAVRGCAARWSALTYLSLFLHCMAPV
jgi:hypothetical protein